MDNYVVFYPESRLGAYCTLDDAPDIKVSPYSTIPITYLDNFYHYMKLNRPDRAYPYIRYISTNIRAKE